MVVLMVRVVVESGGWWCWVVVVVWVVYIGGGGLFQKLTALMITSRSTLLQCSRWVEGFAGT